MASQALENQAHKLTYCAIKSEGQDMCACPSGPRMELEI